MRVRVRSSHEKTQPLGCEIAFFAVRTRLELATYGVTGRYSNQLNYRTFARTTARAMSGKTLIMRYAMFSLFGRNIAIASIPPEG